MAKSELTKGAAPVCSSGCTSSPVPIATIHSVPAGGGDLQTARRDWRYRIVTFGKARWILRGVVRTLKWSNLPRSAALSRM
jgi:hypothetical protein